MQTAHSSETSALTYILALLSLILASVTCWLTKRYRHTNLELAQTQKKAKLLEQQSNELRVSNTNLNQDLEHLKKQSTQDKQDLEQQLTDLETQLKLLTIQNRAIFESNKLLTENNQLLSKRNTQVEEKLKERDKHRILQDYDPNTTPNQNLNTSQTLRIVQN